MSANASLVYASLIASEYANVLDQRHFQDAVSRTLKILLNDAESLQGVSLPWEVRKKFQIYIAAPDFKFIAPSQIDNVVSCLNYHNFYPRRPVLENGEITNQSTASERCNAASADISLLNQCQILVAVLIYDDPGTYIELGIALQKRIPVIVYIPKPNRITENLLTSELPTLVSSNLDEVISEVFKQAAKIYGAQNS
jgi:nucleoside 2-deoxyribosyltransferase